MRRLVSSGSPYEPVVGFSRAVATGHHVAVAGTAPIPPDGSDPPPGPYEQARLCFEIIVAALREVGAGPEHVVRTRVFLVDAAGRYLAARLGAGSMVRSSGRVARPAPWSWSRGCSTRDGGWRSRPTPSSIEDGRREGGSFVP